MHLWRTAHAWMGALGLVAFVLSGQYMHWVHDHLQGMPDGPRLLYRSAHIYLLWAALLNMVLGSFVEFGESRLLRRLQGLASLAVALTPALMCLSFLAESNAAALARPIAGSGIFLALGGVLLHAGCHRIARRRPGRASDPVGGG